jgi:hypothetical protein
MIAFNGTRWNAERAEAGEMLSLADIKEVVFRVRVRVRVCFISFFVFRF